MAEKVVAAADEQVRKEQMRPPMGRSQSAPTDTDEPVDSRETHAAQRHHLRRKRSMDLDDYFAGPRDIARHSKWPLALRLHGSILPKMVLPLIIVSLWSTAITCITMLNVQWLGVDSVLLTITGFVVGLGLSFRSSTAYERYIEGRKQWSQLVLASQALGRVIWVHAVDAKDVGAQHNMLRKVTALNLITAFAVSLKHKLRFEPYTGYPDLEHLVEHLDTLALRATLKDPRKAAPPKKNFFKETGEALGVSFAINNPRKQLKEAEAPLGNLPLEILSYLGTAIDEMIWAKQMACDFHQLFAFNNLHAMNEILANTERVLTTPMPIAYQIAITQITWVYVLLLPFQLISTLAWITIPATIASSYIILGILYIGKEIENPFGIDVNDLPLDSYCDQIASEMDIIATYDKTRLGSFFTSDKNLPLYPLSMANFGTWAGRGEARVRQAIHRKPEMLFEMNKKVDSGEITADGGAGGKKAGSVRSGQTGETNGNSTAAEHV